MSFQALSRKYRPKVFGDVVGQDHLVKALQNTSVQKKPTSAYLFSGTRGVGKTSVARIFAKALTCETPQKEGDPCLKCPNCVDTDRGTSINVQEIDGASHNGVEHVRDLVKNVQYLPSSGQYKVYIIDEVHMLSTAAFNALLKTLEEPPSHVVFILATTEPEKLLETVLSRCQRFDFRHASLEALINHLENILKKEGLCFNGKDPIRHICRQGKGSFRDALSLLEQTLNYATGQELTEEIVALSLGVPQEQALKTLTNALLRGDAKTLESTYLQCLRENVGLKNLTQGILDSFYFIIQHFNNAHELYEGSALEHKILDEIPVSELFWCFETMAKDFEWSLKSADPEKVVEVILKKIALRREFFQTPLPHQTPLPQKSAPQPQQQVGKKDSPSSPQHQETSTTPPTTQSKTEEATPEKNWESFMDDTFQKYPALASSLEQGNILSGPKIQNDALHISIGFDSSAEVFLDYLKDKQVLKKLESITRDYFQKERVLIKLTYVSSEEKKETNFQSRREITKKEMEVKDKAVRENILKNEYIQQAQSLFHSEISKITLNHS